MYSCTLCTGITVDPLNQTIATGQMIKLTCDVYGPGGDDLMYNWTRSRWNGPSAVVVVNGSNMLTIHNANVNDSGEYNCIVFSTSDNIAAVTPNSANITILCKFALTLTI